MEIEKRFTQIQFFLKKHEKLVNHEVLEMNQEDLSPYSEWMKELKTFSTKDLIALEANYNFENIVTPGFVEYIQTITDLISLPKLKESKLEIPKNINRKLSLKKQHELKQIKELIHGDHFFVDIGSGAGHLSSYLISNTLSRSLCLDVEKSYQDIGKEKLSKYAPEVLDKMEFKTVFVEDDTKLDIPEKSYLLGLHTCGDLSSHLINIYLNKAELESFLNFGCCYHKLSANQFNLSTSASFSLNKYSLTLAAKSFKTLTSKDFLKRKAVKDYRYTLHYLMLEKFQDEFTSIGKTHTNDYQGGFADYVYKYYPKASDISHTELKLFYEGYQEKVWEIQLFGIIRSLLSRVIELYIILDRALYLKEHNIDVDILECFNKDLSPRNIAIKAKKI